MSTLVYGVFMVKVGVHCTPISQILTGFQIEYIFENLFS